MPHTTTGAARPKVNLHPDPRKRRATRTAATSTAASIVVATVLALIAGYQLGQRSTDGQLSASGTTAPGQYNEHQARRDLNSGGYTFTHATAAGLSGWNTCTPIAVTVAAANLPVAGPGLITSALRELTHASGLPLRYNGVHHVHVDRRAHSAALRHGTGTRAPIIIGWVDAAGSDHFAASRHAAGHTTVQLDATGTFTSAVIGLDLRAARGPAAAPVLLHELGHAAGLGHTPDPDQLMHTPVPTRLRSYGAGDRQGLAILRQARTCTPMSSGSATRSIQ